MISIFEIFKIGIGPSSSHTVGPMKAAYEFMKIVKQKNLQNNYDRIKVDLYGSLGFTGLGHMSDKAVLFGLSGLHPETIDINKSSKILKTNIEKNVLEIFNRKINFNLTKDIVFNKNFSSISHHSNTINVNI